jgi:cytochrome c biogenesis protein CcdA
MTDALTLPIVIVAALLDSINPCVFGVLIFLIAFMTKVFKSGRRMLIAGMIYTVVVYVTYFLIGLGILRFTVSFGISVAVYWTAAIIAIIVGIVEIKDFFWYGRWFSVRIIPGAEKRMKRYTHYILKAREKNILWSYLIAGLLGIFVVLVELPCTGAPYLAVLALIAKGAYAQGIPLLLLYNLIFILPLIVIISIVYIGKTSKELEHWRKEHRGLMQLAVGLFLIALGAYMIYTII